MLSYRLASYFIAQFIDLLSHVVNGLSFNVKNSSGKSQVKFREWLLSHVVIVYHLFFGDAFTVCDCCGPELVK